MTQLCRAIYISQAVGNAGSNLLSVAEILGVSERNNRRDRLTGVLLSHDGWFPDWSMGQILVTPSIAPLVSRQPLDALTAASAFALLVAAVAQAGAQS